METETWDTPDIKRSGGSRLNERLDQLIGGASTVAVAFGLWGAVRSAQVTGVRGAHTLQSSHNVVWVSPSSTSDVDGAQRANVHDLELQQRADARMPLKNQREVMLNVELTGSLTIPDALSDLDELTDSALG